MSAAEPLAPSRFWFRAVEDTLAVVDLASSDLHVLNALAAELFLELCGAPRHPAAIAAAWAERFGTDATSVARDIDACLAAWRAQGWTVDAGDGRIGIDDGPLPAPSEGAVAVPEPDWSPTGHRRLAFDGIAVDLAFGTTAAAAGASMLGRAQGLFDGVPERPAADAQPAARVALVLDGDRHLVGADDGWTAVTDPVEALGTFISLVYRAAYPGRAVLATLHAAALAGGDGLTAFPGVSGAGKSTLTAFLVAHGWRYATDDFFMLAEAEGSPDPVVLPMPNAISVKEGSLALLEPFYPGIRSLTPVAYGPKIGRFLPVDPQCHVAQPLPVTRLVFPRYRAGAEAAIEPITMRAALLGLVEAGLSTDRLPGRHRYEVLFDWLERLPKYRIVYDDLEQAARCLDMLNAKQG